MMKWKKVLWCCLVMVFPIALGAGISFLLGRMGIYPQTIERIEFLLNALITFASTFLGFILTALSILLALPDSRVMAHIGKEHCMPELLCRFAVALLLGAALIALCLAAGIDIVDTTVPSSWGYAGVALFSAFLFSVLQVGFYMLTIINVSYREKAEKKNRDAYDLKWI